MIASHEQAAPQSASAGGQPVMPADFLARAGLDIIGPAPRRKSPAEWQADADDAFAMARELENIEGLASAAPLYEEAEHDFLNVTWSARGGDVVSPRNMTRRAHSLTKLVEAIDAGVYGPAGISGSEEKAHLQALASQELEAGIAAFIEQRRSAAETPAAEAENVSEVEEVIAEAAVESSVEAGTSEHVAIYGIGAVGEHTAERLEAKGEGAILLFIAKNAMEPRQGSEFIAEMTDRVETGVHDHALAA